MSSRKNAVLAAVLLLAAPVAALSQAPRPVPAGESPSDASIRKWVEEHPEVILETLNRYVAKEQAKKSDARNQQALSAAPEIFDASAAPGIGNPSGKVVLTYFLDGACGYCKAMTPALDDLVSRNPDVRILHRWVSFLGPASEYAMRAATVVWKRHPDKYAAYYHDMMTQKGGLSNDVVDKALARALGDDLALSVRSEIAGGSDRPAVDAALAANSALARQALIDGTPTMFVKGLGPEGVLRGLQKPDDLKAVVERSRTALAR